MSVSQWGILEPEPIYYQTLTPNKTPVILVPGLAFDGVFHRWDIWSGFLRSVLNQAFYPRQEKLGLGLWNNIPQRRFLIHEGDVALSDILLA